MQVGEISRAEASHYEEVEAAPLKCAAGGCLLGSTGLHNTEGLCTGLRGAEGFHAGLRSPEGSCTS